MEDDIYPGSLYDYTAGCYAGVLVTERVMRKLAKLQSEHLEAVKRVLHDNQDEVFPSMWTLHYPGGKQTVVQFIDMSAAVSDRIRLATCTMGPRHVLLAFYASSMGEAREKADARIDREEKA